MGQATAAVDPALIPHAVSRRAPLIAASGIDLASYRDEHVRECIRRSLDREGVRDERALAVRIHADPEARVRFRRAVAVSVTGLFRDPQQFAVIERVVLPELQRAGLPLRVWSAGCANGAELFSVATLLDRLGLLDQADLLGSDLLRENILEAWRAKQEGDRVSDRLRARTRWEVRDLLTGGAPRGPWSLVLCRNVAIYLNQDAKHGLIDLLADSLVPGGFLVLGRSESVIDAARRGLKRWAPHTYRRVS